MDCRAQLSKSLGVPFRGILVDGVSPLDSWKKTVGETWHAYNDDAAPEEPSLHLNEDGHLSSVQEIQESFWDAGAFTILTSAGLWDNNVFYPVSENQQSSSEELSEYALVPRSLAAMMKFWPHLVTSHVCERMRSPEDFIYEIDPYRDTPITANPTEAEWGDILDLAEKMHDQWRWQIEDGQYFPVDFSTFNVKGLSGIFPDIGSISIMILPSDVKARPDLHSDIIALDNDTGDIAGFVSKEFRMVYPRYQRRGIGQALIIADEITGAKAMNATSFTASGYSSRMKALGTLRDIVGAQKSSQEIALSP